ncbi:hypothetical protein DL764_000330 [Monosporascus ibericus]|uniref:Ribonuclease H1 N-terminal domain-containing protein n=1 Tax=Monosporascus ibericus TaxID=155417 RepID=A0A4Q4TWB3_9PEZI|nr:hypothetical protein DL764_000330 [Monosporascus ibericus]
MDKAKTTRYYAVAVDRTPGIYTDRALAQASPSGFKGAKHKRSNTRAEAEKCLRTYGSSSMKISHEDKNEKENAEDGSSMSSSNNSVDVPDMTPPPFMLSVYESSQREPDVQAFSASTYGVKFENSPASFAATANDDPPPPSAQPPSPVQPPPSSFFAQFPDFIPNDSTHFDDEFGRCMSSQGVAPRTTEYRRQRTMAIRHEIKFHYSSQQPSHDSSLSQVEREQAHRLQIYQNMCRAVGLPVHATESACVAALRTVLVNIVDYIDAMRMRRPVEIWTDFAAFRDYTLDDDKRFDSREAKADGGFLAVLLRRLRESRGGARKRKRNSVTEERVVKRERRS